MANFVYTFAIEQLMNGATNLATADMRALLLMTNTTADTEEDKNIVSAFTTLDQCDGANHPATGFTLLSVAVTRTNGGGAHNGYVIFDAADWTITALGAGTRFNQGVLVVKWNTTVANSVPYLWLDTGTGFPFAGDGGNKTITWNALGLGRIKQV